MLSFALIISLLFHLSLTVLGSLSRRNVFSIAYTRTVKCFSLVCLVNFLALVVIYAVELEGGLQDDLV